MIVNGRKLGRQPRAFDQSIPHASSLRLVPRQRGILMPPVPMSINYGKGMPADWGMMLNGPDQNFPNAPALSDCTAAGGHHCDQLWQYNGKGLWVPPTANENTAVEEDYEDSTGYNPNDPSTDQGGIEQDVLKYWMSQGFRRADGTRSKIMGFYEIDPRNPADVRRAIAECGCVYVGADIPEEWTTVSGPGGNWGVSNSQAAGGHCFILIGFDVDQFYAVSWGINAINMSVDALKYVDEVYAPVSADFLTKTGQTPFGMPIDYLQQTLQSIQLAA